MTRPDRRKKGLFQMTLFAFILCAVAFWGGCGKKPAVVKRPLPEPEAVRPEPPPAPKLRKVEQWHALVREKSAAPLAEQLAAVNTFFNAFETAEDFYVWGREDYWATLYETLRRGQGDCEDLALAKYFTLLQMNSGDDRMRLTYVKTLDTGTPHMVLTCRLPFLSHPVVLDTKNNDVRPVTDRSDLVPVYSFNADGYWLARQKEEWRGERLGGAEKLSLWLDVLKRMEIDGRDLAWK